MGKCEQYPFSRLKKKNKRHRKGVMARTKVEYVNGGITRGMANDD